MRKVFIGILVILIVVFVGLLTFNKKQETLMAEVVEKVEYGLLINYEGGLASVNTNGAKIIDRDGNKSTIECIEEGDKIEVIYDGNIKEVYPARINTVYKIRLF